MGNHYDPRDDDDCPTHRQIHVSRLKTILHLLERQSIVYVDVAKMTDEEIANELYNFEQALMDRCRSEALKNLVEKEARDAFKSRAGYYTHQMQDKPKHS